MTAVVVARPKAGDALRSRLGAGRKLHRRSTPRAAGGASARRTSSRFPFPVGGTRAGGLPALLLCCLGLGVDACCCRSAPHQLHSGSLPEDDAAPLNPGLGAAP